jgi:general secretion pathway protein G
MVHELLLQQKFEREFILKDQLQRAAISIMANIAEGFGSQSNKEFAKFLYIAFRSGSEVQSHMHLALDRGLASKEQFERIYQQCDAVRHLTLALIRSLKRSLDSHPAPRTPHRREAGFTLIELLVVIIIIGLLAALVGPKLFGRVGKGKQAAAQAQIELFGAALDNFRLDVGRYPTSDEGLRALLVNPGAIENWDGSYLKKEEIPLDPWGHPYVYKSPGEHGDYDIFSYGGDGVAGGEGENQDLVSWKGIKRGSERVE